MCMEKREAHVRYQSYHHQLKRRMFGGAGKAPPQRNALSLTMSRKAF